MAKVFKIKGITIEYGWFKSEIPSILELIIYEMYSDLLTIFSIQIWKFVFSIYKERIKIKTSTTKKDIEKFLVLDQKDSDT